jgi:tetratricopeptide (TPR) repeat protein
MKDRLKIGATVGAALALAFLGGASGAQTPGDSKGNGQNPLDQNDNGPEAVTTYRGNSSDALVYNTAMDDYNHKNYKEAASGLKDYLKNNPKDAQAHRLMADIDVAQNNIAAAIPEWEAAVKLDKSDKSSAVNLGVAYMQTGSYDKAVDIYERAVARSPKDPQLNMQLAIALDSAGKHAEAAAGFERAAALDPKNSAPALYAGLLNHQTGHDDKAVPELKNALALGTTEKFQAYAALAEAASAAKQNDEAIKDYTLAAQAKPDDFVTQYNLGVLEQNAGKKTEAEASYRKALTLKTDDVKAMAGVRSNLSLLLIDDGKLDEAASQLDQATKGDPKNAEYENNLGQVYEKLNKKDLAIAAYTKAVQLDPSLAGAKASLTQLQK